MFGGAPEGKYNVTAVKNDDENGHNDEVSQKNSMNEAVLETLKGMGYLDASNVSTDKFNEDFKDTTEQDVPYLGKNYKVTVTPDGDNYNVNVTDDGGMDGNVTFTKVPA